MLHIMVEFLLEVVVYEVKENTDGDLEVTAPYQTKRLIVESDQVKDTCGASEVYVNEMDHETILQYDSEEKTEEAFQQLSRTYSSCYPDKVVSVEDSTMGLSLSQGEPIPGEAIIWD